MTTEIKLEFSRKYFEEIYFKDNQGSYMKSKMIRPAFISLVVVGMIFLAAFMFAFFKENWSWVIFPGILLCVSAWNYGRHFLVLFKWRRKVFDFLKREEKHLQSKLVVSDNYFTLVQDNTETHEKWENFSRIQVTDTYICFEGKENIIIPAKSMSGEEYRFFRQMVSEKLR